MTADAHANPAEIGPPATDPREAEGQALHDLAGQASPDTPPALLRDMAEDFAAEGQHSAPRAALQAAADLKALAQLAQNSAAPLMVLMNRLAALNDQGQRHQAAAELETALETALASPDLDATTRTALHELALTQDRICHRPDATAKRLLAALRSAPQPGGLFRALHDAWEVWHDRGTSFDLTVALHLARANEERSKGAQHVQALTDLGLTQFELGRTLGRADHLRHSIASFRSIVGAVKARNEPAFWADAMGNLAAAQLLLARQEDGTARLTEAIKSARAALALQPRARVPQDWAHTTTTLAQAMALLAERTGDATLAAQAADHLAEAQAIQK